MTTTSFVALLIVASVFGAVLLFSVFLLRRIERRFTRPRVPVVSPHVPAEIPAPVVPPEPPGDRVSRTRDLPYVRQSHLLTRTEREFFAVLRQSAPTGWDVFPQVRLANLIQVRRGSRNWQLYFNWIAQKCVDFVICDPADSAPRLVVELDDSSHERVDRRKRDVFVDDALAAAGLPILHVRVQRSYDTAALAAQIHTAIGLAPPTVTSVPPMRIITSATPKRDPALTTISEPTVHSAPPRWACRGCNAEISATAKHCPACGRKLEL